MFKNLTSTQRWMLRLGATVLGCSAGFAYYYFIGCVSGTCPITSNPWISTAYGGVMGLLLVPASGGVKANGRQGD